MAREAFAPTDELRRIVTLMTSYGIKQEDIATELGLRSPKTLRKYFRDELDHGRIAANLKVSKTAYTMATSGKCVKATIYWLERRAGWRLLSSSVPTQIIGDFLVGRETEAA